MLLDVNVCPPIDVIGLEWQVRRGGKVHTHAQARSTSIEPGSDFRIGCAPPFERAPNGAASCSPHAQGGHSQAAPRTPDESPCMFFTTRVTSRSENTLAGRRAFTSV